MNLHGSKDGKKMEGTFRACLPSSVGHGLELGCHDHTKEGQDYNNRLAEGGKFGKLDSVTKVEICLCNSDRCNDALFGTESGSSSIHGKMKLVVLIGLYSLAGNLNF